MDLNSFLKNANQKFQEEKSKAGKFDEIPDGKYLCQLSGAELMFSKNGRPMLHWSFVVRTGEYDGELVHDYQLLDKDDSFRWLAMRLNQFELQIGDLDELPASLAELTASAPYLIMEVKTTKGKNGQDYTNKRVQRVWTDGTNPLDDPDFEAPTNPGADPLAAEEEVSSYQPPLPASNGSAIGGQPDEADIPAEDLIGKMVEFHQGKKKFRSVVKEVNEEKNELLVEVNGQDVYVSGDDCILVGEEV